jgi:glutaminase
MTSVPTQWHQHIGMEPSGQAFNARVLMSDVTGRPHNPMINAGAIMAAALIKSDRPLHRRLDYVRNMWAKMTGGSIPRFNAWMAQEESRTGDNNRALGYMMKAAGVLPHGEDAVDHELRDALELYFSVCSLGINTRELATAAATLANNGVCPVTIVVSEIQGVSHVSSHSCERSLVGRVGRSLFAGIRRLELQRLAVPERFHPDR